jgi:signal transduction histidine kinase
MNEQRQHKKLYTLSDRFIQIILAWMVVVAVAGLVLYSATGDRLAALADSEMIRSIRVVDSDDRILFSAGEDTLLRSGPVIVQSVEDHDGSGPLEMRLYPDPDWFRRSYVAVVFPWIIFAILFLALLLGTLFLIFRSRYLVPLRELTFSVRDNRMDVLTDIARRTGAVEFHTMIASFIGLMNQSERRNIELEAAISEHTKELEHAHARLLRQEKLASLGRLAAGVAHEINNPAGYIVGNLDVLSDYISLFKERNDRFNLLMDRIVHLNGEAHEDLQRMVREIRKNDEKADFSFVMADLDDLIHAVSGGMSRITRIVQGLNAFARDKNQAMERIDLNDAIDAGLQIVWNELKYNYTVSVHANEHLATTAVPGQIEQVIVNMLINARDATDPGGTITVSLEEADGYAVLSISDTGSGMPEETADKIFDPFFTTKPVGSGAGLGLAICHEIITNSGGTITVESTENKGTTFIITLPLTPFPLEELGEADES